MWWIATVMLIGMTTSAAARPVARTVSSSEVDGLVLVLEIWDANYGRGPIKARLTVKNRGKEAQVLAPLEQARVELRFPSRSTGDCTITTRELTFPAQQVSERRDRTIRPGGSYTTTFDLSAAARTKANGASPLVPGWYLARARYKTSTTELETAALQLTVKGSPRAPMCARNPGWDAIAK